MFEAPIHRRWPAEPFAVPRGFLVVVLLASWSCSQATSPDFVPGEVLGTGVLDDAVEDPSRPDLVASTGSRRWPVRWLYPVCSDGPVGVYAHPELVAALVADQYFRQSEETLSSWSTRPFGIVDAAPCDGLRPLLTLSNGLGVSGVNYSLLAERLVDLGWIVAIIDHPYGAVSRLPGGRLSRPSEDSALARLDQDPEVLSQRVADWTLDILHTVHWARTSELGTRLGVDPRRIYSAGHSMGGAAALDACGLDPEIGACVDLDGAPFGTVTLESGFRGRGLVVFSDPLYTDADHEARGRTREQWEAMGSEIAALWDEIEEQSPGSLSRVSVAGTGHLSFSDAPLLFPDAISRFGGRPMEGARALTVVSEMLHRFLLTDDRAWAAWVEATSELELEPPT